MSGWSEAVQCPNCGTENSFEVWFERYEVGGLCLECGYMIETVEKQLTLEEVNEERAEVDMKPLTELKPKLKDKSKEV